MTIQEIKQFLKNNKITYESLSEMSGVSIGTLKSIFSGRTPTPRIDTLEAIEKALGLHNEPTTILTYKANMLIELISTLTDEECDEIIKFIDFVISKRT